MRILIFSWRGPRHPLAGGAEQVMHEHMKGWVHAGHEVTLFTSRPKGFSKYAKVDNINIVRRGCQYLGVQLTAFLYYLANRNDYDILIDQFHGLPFFTPLFSRKPKMAVVQEIAREVWMLNPLPVPLNWVVGVIGRIGDPLVYQPYRRTQFMTGSKSAKDDLVSYGIAKAAINIVPHGVKVKSPSKSVTKEKKRTLLFLGRLSKDKGIEDAIKCFSLLNHDRYNFWVIGSAETESYGKQIEHLAKNLGIKDRIKFWGFVSEEKKFELLKRAHILVNPSKFEGWGLVNIEANSMGTPVVAYRSQGLVDSVKEGESGAIVSENTPAALAKKVKEILSDHEKYEKLSQGAISWSKKFSWNESIKKSLRLIEYI